LLQARRTELGLSRYRVAKEIGVHEPYLRSAEIGRWGSWDAARSYILYLAQRSPDSWLGQVLAALREQIENEIVDRALEEGGIEAVILAERMLRAPDDARARVEAQRALRAQEVAAARRAEEAAAAATNPLLRALGRESRAETAARDRRRVIEFTSHRARPGAVLEDLRDEQEIEGEKSRRAVRARRQRRSGAASASTESDQERRP
jgi:transcriptional regulator with XRE-family HTH domain